MEISTTETRNQRQRKRDKRQRELMESATRMGFDDDVVSVSLSASALATASTTATASASASASTSASASATAKLSPQSSLRTNQALLADLDNMHSPMHVNAVAVSKASSVGLASVLGGGHRRVLPTASAALTAHRRIKGTSTDEETSLRNLYASSARSTASAIKGTSTSTKIDQGTKSQARSKRKREKQRTEAYIRDQLWRTHQSVATVCEKNGGYCQYSLCPGLDRINARKRPFPSTYRCYECSVRLGKNVFLCNTIKKGEAVLCHMKYHTQNSSDRKMC